VPIFEYKCNSCSAVFEELVSAKQADRVRCPKCDSKATERLISVFAARATEHPSVGDQGGGCSRCGDPDGPCG
jgi:putative FmdB family regulatory protein